MCCMFIWSFFLLGRALLGSRAWEHRSENWLELPKRHFPDSEHLSSRILFCLIGLKVMTFWQEGSWTHNFINQFDLSCLFLYVIRQVLILSSFHAYPTKNNNFHAMCCVPNHRGSQRLRKNWGLDHGQPACTVSDNTSYYKWSERLSFGKLLKGNGRTMESVISLLDCQHSLDFGFYRPTWLGALLYCLQTFDLLVCCTLGKYAFKSAL